MEDTLDDTQLIVDYSPELGLHITIGHTGISFIPVDKKKIAEAFTLITFLRQAYVNAVINNDPDMGILEGFLVATDETYPQIVNVTKENGDWEERFNEFTELMEDPNVMENIISSIEVLKPTLN